jgi:hypothetical protein
MRFPRVRFSVLRLMSAVAIAATILALYDRHERFAAMAKLHSDEVKKLSDNYCRTPRIPYEYHTGLKQKYERAARYPFLPVAPDPPGQRWH